MIRRDSGVDFHQKHMKEFVPLKRGQDSKRKDMILIFQHLPTTKKDHTTYSFVLVGGYKVFSKFGGFGFFAILGVDQCVSVLHHSATRTM